jgi:hypothetical protein
MSTHEKYLQYAKVLLLTAILAFCAWSVGNHPPSVSAQLGASSGFSFAHITTAVNTQVSAGQVTFHTLVINGGTAGAITVVDTSAANCTGGKTIAVIATLTGASAATLAYDIQTVNGLCITTAAASDVTVTFR